MNTYLLIAVCFLSYGFGGLNGAYYLTEFYLKDDIRRYGSGNVGATNAGRVLGRKGFVLTVLIDVAKVAAALTITFWISENEPKAMALGSFFLLAGHLFPLQLGFRGGKGIVVYLAAALFLAPLSILVLGVIMAFSYWVVKDFKKAGFISMLTIPITSYLVNQPAEYSSILLIMLIVVLLAHKKSPPPHLNHRQQ
jgi:acyl phosphate:glycerol-3-phosphate acyltransferase